MANIMGFAAIGAFFKEDIKQVFSDGKNLFEKTFHEYVERPCKVYLGKCYSDDELKLVKRIQEIHKEIFSNFADELEVKRDADRNEKIISSHCFEIDQGNSLFNESSIFKAAILLSGIQNIAGEQYKSRDLPFNRYCETVKNLMKDLATRSIENRGKNGAIDLAEKVYAYSTRVRDHYASIPADDFYIHAASGVAYVVKEVELRARSLYHSIPYGERLKVLDKDLSTLLPYLHYLIERVSYYDPKLLELDNTHEKTDFKVKDVTHILTMRKASQLSYQEYLAILSNVKLTIKGSFEAIKLCYRNVSTYREQLVGETKRSAKEASFITESDTNNGELTHQFDNLKNRMTTLNGLIRKQIQEAKSAPEEIFRLKSEQEICRKTITGNKRQLEIMEESPRKAKMPRLLGSKEPLALGPESDTLLALEYKGS